MAATPEAFTLQIDAFVKKAKGRAEEFCSEFAQDVAEEVVRATPYKTGFMRASWVASIGKVPGGKMRAPKKRGKATTDVTDAKTVAKLNLVASEFKPGEIIYFTNSAVYAMRVHYGFVGTDSLGRKYAQPPRPWVTDVVVRSNLIAQKTARRVAKD